MHPVVHVVQAADAEPGERGHQPHQRDRQPAAAGGHEDPGDGERGQQPEVTGERAQRVPELLEAPVEGAADQRVGLGAVAGHREPPVAKPDGGRVDDDRTERQGHAGQHGDEVADGTLPVANGDRHHDHDHHDESVHRGLLHQWPDRSGQPGQHQQPPVSRHRPPGDCRHCARRPRGAEQLAIAGEAFEVRRGGDDGEQPRRDDGGPAAGQRPGRRAGRRRGDSGGRNGQQPGHRVPARGRHQPVDEEEALGSVDPGHVAVQRLAPRPQPGHLGEAGLVGAERDGQEPGAEDGAEDDGEADAGHRGAAAEA